MSDFDPDAFRHDFLKEVWGMVQAPPPPPAPATNDIDLAVRGLLRHGYSQEQALAALREKGVTGLSDLINEQRTLDAQAAKAAADEAYANSEEGRRAAAAAALETQAKKQQDARLARAWLVEQGILTPDDDPDLISDDEAITMAFTPKVSEEAEANDLSANIKAASGGDNG